MDQRYNIRKCPDKYDENLNSNAHNINNGKLRELLHYIGYAHCTSIGCNSVKKRFPPLTNISTFNHHHRTIR